MKDKYREIQDLLTSVGAETFIKYYKVYEAQKFSTKNNLIRSAFAESGEIWASTSTNTKASAGKMIFVKGYEQEVLYKIIHESTKLNQSIIDTAKQYLFPIIQTEIENIESLSLSDIQTEKTGLIKLRIQQSMYRKMVMNHWETCAITNCKNSSLLIASHIKPWKESNNLEKLDPFNGILLSPLYDKLFDRYLISFDDKGVILLSNKINSEDLTALKISPVDRLNPDKLLDAHRKYLAQHRHIFNLENS